MLLNSDRFDYGNRFGQTRLVVNVKLVVVFGGDFGPLRSVVLLLDRGRTLVDNHRVSGVCRLIEQRIHGFEARQKED